MTILATLILAYIGVALITVSVMAYYYDPQGSSERTIYILLSIFWPFTIGFWVYMGWRAMR